MLGIFITLFTFLLVLISLFMGLVILMQRSNTQGGLGAAFGGGVADSAFGAETTNVLTKATKWSGIAFFVVASALYLMHIADNRQVDSEEVLPEFTPESVEAAPVTTEEGAPAIAVNPVIPAAPEATAETTEADAETPAASDQAPADASGETASEPQDQPSDGGN